MVDEGQGAQRGAALDAAIGGALALVVFAAGLWTARAPIATNFIDQELAARGVRARYRIAQLGLDRQRLTDVVIGDPAAPDFIADAVEVTTAFAADGARVTGVRVDHGRLRARLREGRVSFGAIDRLLPPPSGKPFALPAIALDARDLRLRLETPAGIVGARLSGAGRLDDGFTGTLALITDRLGSAGCAGDRVAGVLAVSIAARQPALRGPLRAQHIACAGAEARGVIANLDATLDERLDRWRGTARWSADRLAHPGGEARGLSGMIGFEGSPRRTQGDADIVAARLALRDLSLAEARIDGRYQWSARSLAFDGHVTGERGRLGSGWRARLAGAGGAAAGTPLAPILARAGAAAARAADAFALAANLGFAADTRGFSLTLGALDMTSTSGARATLSRGAGLSLTPAGARIDGLAAISGGDLPEAVLRLSQPRAGAAISGAGFVRRYDAGDARIVLDALDFRAEPGGRTRVTTRAVLSGPFADGRVEELALPITALWDGGSRLLLNPDCAPLAFARLRFGALALDPGRVTLCPEQGALLTLDRGRLRGAARVAGLRLAGRLSDAPLQLAAARARLGLTDRAFSLNDAALTLGEGDRATILAVDHLDGRGDAGLSGGFAGARGQIARVPLRMSGGAGAWRFAGGALRVTGALDVADAASNAACPPDGNWPAGIAERPRFCPLRAPDVTLTLADQRIEANGTLVRPADGARVATVAMTHDLRVGTGQADLTVSGLRFSDTLQPKQLAPATYGLIDETRGTVSGTAQLRWTRDGVTSEGRFRTEGADLAATFGPVEGLRGEVRFTDLLDMTTAPGQVARVASINPGVPVEGGVVRYHLLDARRVAIEGGEWPFAGGRLVLEPALLDFNEDRQRRLTFRVVGVDAALFLQQFDFKNLNATGTFDGVLPMVFDAHGGRIEGGHLTVREGGGTIAYVGEVSQRDLGFWGNTAFQALKSLVYQTLELDMNGPLDGEMITEVRFTGVSQGRGAKSNFLVRRLQRLPFVFNVRIKAPFRQLIDSAQSYYNPRRLIERNLPALIDAQNAAVQAQASGAVPQGETK